MKNVETQKCLIEVIRICNEQKAQISYLQGISDIGNRIASYGAMVCVQPIHLLLSHLFVGFKE